MNVITFKEKYSEYKTAVEQQLIEVMSMLPNRGSEVAKAAEYSLFNGGKRVRGVLVLSVCDMLCGSYEKALNLAASIEMIHCYSLIHDDLPCMDNSDLRRGMPSCHVKYNEATALLAGDCLLTHAFGIVATAEIPSESLLTAVQLLSYSSGLGGMIYGQELDLKNESRPVTESMLKETHQNKTGALIATAVQFGAIAGAASSHEYLTLREFAFNLGLAFQVIDDVLDGTGTVEELGKPTGNDNECGKRTYFTILGLNKAQDYAKQLAETNVEALKTLFDKRTEFLLNLQDELLVRRS